MISICTDPAVYPLREVRLTDSSAAPIIRPLPGTQNANLAFGRPDGGRNLILRPPQSLIEVTVRNFTYAQYEALLDLQGLQRRSRTRTGVYLFPNFDAHTRLWAPLCRSTWALLYDKATDRLLKTAPTTATRNALAYFQDERGNLAQVDVDKQRFVPSVLGNGFLPNAGYQNLLSPAHPANGTLMWTGVLGTPTIAWTTEVNSPVLSKGGCVKITKTGSGLAVARLSATIDNTTAGHHVWGSLWLQGAGRVQLVLTVGANTITSTTFTLTRQWRRYNVGPLPKTDAATTVTLDLSIQVDVYDRVVFAAPHTCWKQGDTDKQVPQEWDDAATNAGDVLTYTAPLATGELTLTSLGLMPPTQTVARIWRSLTAPANLLAQFNAAGFAFDGCGGSASAALNAVYWQSVEGRPYHLTCRLQPGAGDIRLAILNTDGSLTYATGSFSNADVQDWTGANTQNIGGNSTNRIGSATVQHVRLDSRYWTDAERDLHEKMYLQEAFRKALSYTTGRLYEIKSVDLLPPHVTRQESDGKLILEEIVADGDLAAVA